MRGSSPGLLLADEIEIPKINDRVKKIGSDKDRVHLPDGVGEENQPSPQAEIPEGNGNDTLLLLLRGDPLDDESHGEHCLPEKAEEQPEVQLKLRILYRQVLEKIGYKIKK